MTAVALELERQFLPGSEPAAVKFQFPRNLPVTNWRYRPTPAGRSSL